MLDIASESTQANRPAIVICAWDIDDGSVDLIEDLSGQAWSPAGARTIAVPASDPDSLASILSSHLSDQRCRALLLVGRTRRSEGFRLQMRAESRSVDGSQKLDGVGPSVARATAPVSEIVRALNEAGMAADASSDAEDDVGSYLLYRVLSNLPEGIDTPAVGLLRAPQHEPDAAVREAVKTAAQAMARHMSPLPRSRGI